MLSAECLLPSACSEILAYTDGVVASPGSIRAKVGGAQVSITCAEAIKKKMLGNPRFETFSKVDGGAPGMLDADRVKRPCVKSLRNGLAEQEAWLTPEHKAAEGSPAKRSHF